MARVEVIGHRGARALFPENTLQGFLAAAALGVSTFELDVGMTADDQVVVCHDTALNPELTRDASGAWLAPPGPLIRSLTLMELARYDVGRARPGSSTGLLFPDQRPIDGARVPTLASVLAALPEARFIIEVKTDPVHPDRTVAPTALVDAVLNVVERAGPGAAERVIIEGFDWRVPRHVLRARAGMRVAWLTRAETVRDKVLWGLAAACGPDASVPELVEAAGGASALWTPDHADLTEALVRQAHDLGLSVVPWTVNRADDMRRVIDWQVDGLISDQPDLALSIVGR